MPRARGKSRVSVLMVFESYRIRVGETSRVPGDRRLAALRVSDRMPAMKFPHALSIYLIGLSFATFATAEQPQVKLQPIYENLEIERPVSLVVPPDGSNRRFLVEQTGHIRILPADESASSAETFFDLTDRMQVEKDFEEGLLGLLQESLALGASASMP